jgi:membrane dipeptidase
MLRSTLLLVALGTACAAPTAVRPAAGPVDPDRPVVQGPVVLGPEALRIARDLPVFDGHNDLPGELTLLVRQGFDGCDLREPQPQFHTDIPRLFQGGVGAQFWSVYVSASTEKTGDALERTLEQVDLVRRMVARYPDVFELASTADDVERIRGRRKIACMMGIEGGYSIENSLAHLRLFHALGVRYMTLTHSDTTAWADSSTDAPRHGGLSPFGEEVVREMNRLGMLVDVSHVSLETVDDALRVSQAPIIASHSSAFALAEHPRNLPDDRLRAIAANRGVVMVNFSSSFIHPESARKTQDMLQVMRELRARHPDEGEFRAAMGAVARFPEARARQRARRVRPHRAHRPRGGRGPRGPGLGLRRRAAAPRATRRRGPLSLHHAGTPGPRLEREGRAQGARRQHPARAARSGARGAPDLIPPPLSAGGPLPPRRGTSRWPRPPGARAARA